MSINLDNVETIRSTNNKAQIFQMLHWIISSCTKLEGRGDKRLGDLKAATIKKQACCLVDNDDVGSMILKNIY
jgi:hypothetical protein